MIWGAVLIAKYDTNAIALRGCTWQVRSRRSCGVEEAVYACQQLRQLHRNLENQFWFSCTCLITAIFSEKLFLFMRFELPFFLNWAEESLGDSYSLESVMNKRLKLRHLSKWITWFYKNIMSTWIIRPPSDPTEAIEGYLKWYRIAKLENLKIWL